MMPEPNYAINLELAELVNQKKANTSVSFSFLHMIYEDGEMADLAVSHVYVFVCPRQSRSSTADCTSGLHDLLDLTLDSLR